MFIELFVKCTNIDVYIRMLILHTFNTFRSCNNAHEVYVPASSFLEELYSG